ncbi:hypothetical protein, partial [Neorhizobium galegae]|uniref:hypothetical protein n=1 Tax=Neorhizobium galegae TaxID=399 RepID=UPI002105729F
FCASENCDAFIVFRSFPSQENAPENSNQNWSSLKGSDQTPENSSARWPKFGEHFKKNAGANSKLDKTWGQGHRFNTCVLVATR